MVVMILLEFCTSDSSSCYHAILISNTMQSRDILVSANPGPPGKCLFKTERERERERDFLPDLYHYHTCTVQNLIQLLMNAMITVSKGCSNSTVYYPVFYITEQIINHGKKLQMMHFVTYLSYLS